MRRKPYVDGFYDECWKANVWLIWPCNQKQLQAYLRKNFNRELENDDDGWGGKWLKLENVDSQIHLIALREWSLEPEHIATLAHECFHATEGILERNVKHADATSEVFAYLLDSIVRRSLRILAGKAPNTDWKR